MMIMIERAVIDLIMFFVGVLLGIGIFFSSNIELQAYFWFPLVFGFVAMGDLIIGFRNLKVTSE